MKKACFRCEGDGFLPQFAHIKGGVCFTCGGDGEVETVPPRKTQQMSEKEFQGFASYMTTEDFAGIDPDAFDAEKRKTLVAAMREKGMRLLRSGKFGEREQSLLEKHGEGDSPADVRALQPLLVDMQERLVREMPRPYEDDAYFKKGVVSMVPTAWAMKFQGNVLRYDVKDDLLKDIAENGMREVPYFTIGQEDRHVLVGEGNHRMNAYHALGLDFVPMRVMRMRNAESHGSHPYDKMSRVPRFDYFKGDAAPKDVFDTYYDQGAYQERAKSEQELLAENVQRLLDKHEDSPLSTSDMLALGDMLAKLDRDEHPDEYERGMELLDEYGDDPGEDDAEILAILNKYGLDGDDEDDDFDDED